MKHEPIIRMFRAGACLAWLLTAGCCHLRMSKPAGPAEPLPAAVSAGFDYPKRPNAVMKDEEIKREPKYDVERIELPAPGDGFDPKRVVTLDYYAPRDRGKKPVVVVVPISGGDYQLENYISSYFAKRGWAAVIVRRRKPPREPVNGEELSAMLRQSVNDIRRAIDWVETRPELDATKVGVFGVSQGGIKSAILASVDPRVQGAVLGLAGGDIPYILRHSEDRGIARRRKRMLKEQSLTPAELEARFRAGFECDPNSLAAYVPREKVLLVLACCDRVVPIKKGRELRQKLGRPETIFLPTGHYTALLCLPYLRHESFEFFRKRFYREPTRDRPATAQAHP